MERLTAYNSENHKNVAYYPVCFQYPCNGFGCKIDGCKLDHEVCQRLAAYEDTGLEPEEVAGLCTMDKRSRMAKMLRWEEAEQEGRLVVLPCKVGDTVWLLKTKCKYAGEDNKPWESCSRYWDNVYKREHMWGCAGRDDDGKEFRCEKEDREWYAQSMEYSLFLYGPDIVLGKNLFLTREDAEAALAEEGGNNE